MSSPTISVCMPCCNGAKWLAAALESVLAQSFTDFEIVLVDDGSTDGSLDIAKAYAARGVRVFSQPNAGQCAACNHALRAAQGRYIKFFDSDDLMSPGMLSLQLAALHGKEDHIAYSEWARFYQEPSEANFVTRPGWHDAAPRDWLVEMWQDSEPMMQCGQFLAPRSLLERTGGWDERLSLVNDFEFFTRVALGSMGVIFTPGARLYYRSGIATSLSGSRTPTAWQSAFDSTVKGTGHLLTEEDSERTRHAAAAILQGLVYSMYPEMPELIADLEQRIAGLGGATLRPPGGRGFQACARLLGWKAARHLQILAGKHPRRSAN